MPQLMLLVRDIVVSKAEGLIGKGIAARLGVSLKTVENHKIRVFDKLGVRTRVQAVREAVRLGLVEET